MTRGIATPLIVFATCMTAVVEPVWAAEPEFWGYRLLGRLHPLVVHFPIALVLAAVWVEAVQLLRRRPVAGNTARVFVTLGSAGAVLAALLGWQAGEHADYTGKAAEILETHRWLGVGTAAGSIAVTALCVAARSRASAGPCGVRI